MRVRSLGARRENLGLACMCEQLVQTFEDAVFPINKYSRRKGDIRGGTLYLPGLIKAYCSNWTYKCAAGRRRRPVSLTPPCPRAQEVPGEPRARRPPSIRGLARVRRLHVHARCAVHRQLQLQRRCTCA
jgi:hypothetical protein